MTTINAPATHAQTKGDLGLSYALLGSLVYQRLTELWDPMIGGLIAPPVDLSGSGSDTARFRNVTGIGAAAGFTAMSGETDAGTASTWTSGYDEITIGRYHLAFEESFQRAGLQSDGVTLEAIAAAVAETFMKLQIGLLCDVGATFATNAADAAAMLDVDDVINLRNLAQNTAGFSGPLVSVTKGRQINSLLASIRSETALKFPTEFGAFQSLRNQGGYQFDFLTGPWYASEEINVSGGDDYGFSYSPGAVVSAVMSTAGLGNLTDASPVIVPEYGLVGTRQTTGSQALKRIDFNAYTGLGKLAATVRPQWKLQSNST